VNRLLGSGITWARRLVAAAGAQDVPGQLAIFGGEGSVPAASGEAVADKNERAMLTDLIRRTLDVTVTTSIFSRCRELRRVLGR